MKKLPWRTRRDSHRRARIRHRQVCGATTRGGLHGFWQAGLCYPPCVTVTSQPPKVPADGPGIAVRPEAVARPAAAVRHSALVRATHWLTFIAFMALLITGGEIVISHPRFYWGEVGNVNTKPLFVIPIPSSRDTVPTEYNYVMPDQNGWSRYLHFEAAWVRC